MTKTARQIVAEEVIRYLDRTDIGVFTEIQRLEDQCQIWEYGKWCAQSGVRLGYPRQLKFRHGRPESTPWQALRDLSDDEAMRIHAATIGLTESQLDVLVRVYQLWQPVHVAREQMRIGMTSFDLLRRDALRHIAQRLSALTSVTT